MHTVRVVAILEATVVGLAVLIRITCPCGSRVHDGAAFSGGETMAQSIHKAYDIRDEGAGGTGTAHGDLPEPALNALASEALARMGRAGPAEARPQLRGRPAEAASQPDPDAAAERFAAALVGPDPDAAARIVDGVRRFGASTEAVHLGMIAPALARLGRWWESDRASFAAVSLGIARIYTMLRAVRDDTPRPLTRENREAAFATVPGEGHSLGATLAADMFRADGWEIELFAGFEHAALVEALSCTRAPVIGLSASGREHLPALVRLLGALAAARQTAPVFVSGGIAAEVPDLVGLTGVAGATADYHAARVGIETLWAGQPAAARSA